MNFLKSFLMISLILISASFLVSSCGDDDNSPSNSEPSFTMSVELADITSDSLGGYMGESFMADLDQPFTDDDGNTFPSQAFAVINEDTLQLGAFDIRNGDTSTIQIITQLKPGVIGSYKLSAFSEDLLSTAIGGVFGGIFGEEPSTEPIVATDVEAVSFYISTQLPPEVIFAALFGAFESTDGGVLNITEYDETNKTISGSFSYDYKVTDEETIFLKFENGVFNKVPVQ